MIRKHIFFIKNFIFNCFIKNKKIFSVRVSKNVKIGFNTEVQTGTEIDLETEIGSYSYIGRNCNITKSNIGNYVSIANNVSIGQGEHVLSNLSTSSLFYDEAYSALTKEKCIIENDVWLGVDSIVLRGVTVGNGAVIGANAVVTKDVPPYAIVVGSPARVIKYRFDKDKIDMIINSKWWEESPEEAKKIFERLNVE